MHKHPTLSAWHREEDGSYKAEHEGFELLVTWRPESKDARRGFLWKATSPDGKTYEAGDVVEEIEEAMGTAEDAVRVVLHPELL
jgi:hypothetical protein